MPLPVTIGASTSLWYEEGAIHGAHEMIAEMKKYDAEFGVETEFETAGYFADDIQVVAHEHVRLTRWDRTLGGKAVHIFEFKDGRISKVTAFTGDPQRMATLFT